MPLLHTEAIILRRIRTKDADALVVLYGKTAGKITTSTKSVLKTQSRYAGVTQPFNRIHAVLYAKKEDQDIWTITQVSLIESYDQIQQNVSRLAYASCLAEWLDFFCHDRESNLVIWNLFVSAMQRWNQVEPSMEDLLFYEWKFLSSAGLQPEINHCLKTRKEDAPAWVFIPQEGGIINSSLVSGGMSISQGTVQALRLLSRSQTPPAVRLSPQQKHETNLLLKIHLEYHAGLKSRARFFLERWLQWTDKIS